MAAGLTSPCLLGGFQKEINSTIVNGIPLPDEMKDIITTEKLEKFGNAIASASYWNKKLKEEINDVTVILGLLSTEGLKVPEISIILDNIEKIVSITNVSKVYFTENWNFIGISFTNKEAATTVKKFLKTIDQNVVFYFGHTPNNVISVRILWATPSMKLEEIKKPLEVYSKDLNLNFETIDRGGHIISTTVVSGTITLKDNFKADDLPYLINVYGIRTKELLLIVKGRPPTCLKCKQKGHVRKQCTVSPCQECFTYHSQQSLCQKRGYAQAAKRNVINFKRNDFKLFAGDDNQRKSLLQRIEKTIPNRVGRTFKQVSDKKIYIDESQESDHEENYIIGTDKSITNQDNLINKMDVVTQDSENDEEEYFKLSELNQPVINDVDKTKINTDVSYSAKCQGISKGHKRPKTDDDVAIVHFDYCSDNDEEDFVVSQRIVTRAQTRLQDKILKPDRVKEIYKSEENT